MERLKIALALFVACTLLAAGLAVSDHAARGGDAAPTGVHAAPRG